MLVKLQRVFSISSDSRQQSRTLLSPFSLEYEKVSECIVCHGYILFSLIPSYLIMYTSAFALRSTKSIQWKERVTNQTESYCYKVCKIIDYACITINNDPSYQIRICHIVIHSCFKIVKGMVDFL